MAPVCGLRLNPAGEALNVPPVVPVTVGEGVEGSPRQYVAFGPGPYAKAADARELTTTATAALVPEQSFGGTVTVTV